MNSLGFHDPSEFGFRRSGGKKNITGTKWTLPEICTCLVILDVVLFTQMGMLDLEQE